MYSEDINRSCFTPLQMDQLADRLPWRTIRCGPRGLPHLRAA
jgi:hypothetical protein